MKKYKNPPKAAYRAMGLGVENNGKINVIAGFQVRWWDPVTPLKPIIVSAKILRIRKGDK